MSEAPENPIGKEDAAVTPDLPGTELLSTIDAAQAGSKPLPLPEMPERLGQYKIEKIIGRGAMGVVYLARQDGLERSVALKLLVGGAHASETVRSRFMQEARAIAKIRHPNIVSVFEVSEHEGHPYFAMEYINGMHLGAFSRKFQLTSPVVIADLCARIGEAVQMAHENGIVHRDLKPGNILIDGRGEPIITDFGLSKDLTNVEMLSMGGEIMGTPAFMSPEQAEGKTGITDERSDVYALGAILYFLTTRRDPFKGKNLVQILSRVIHDEPTPITDVNPEMPGDLEAICMKAMEKDRARRYPSARTFARDLRKFIDGEPISATPWTRRRRVAMFLHRRKQSLGGALLTLLLLGLGVFLSMQFFAKSYLDVARGYATSDNPTLREEITRSLSREIVKPDQLDPKNVPEALRILNGMVSDPAPDVQNALLDFYAAFGDLPELKEAMGDEQFQWLLAKAEQNARPDQRDLALAAIGKIRRPEFADYLIRRLREPDPDLRGEVVRALGDQKTRKSLYPLLTMIASDPACRAEAETALDKFYAEGRIALIGKQNREVMDTLQRLSKGLADYNATLEDALSALEPTPEESDPFRMYRDKLESEDPVFRLEALHAIGLSGHPAADAVFLQALLDEEEHVGFMAAMHLSRNLTSRARRGLLAYLGKEGDAATRRRAAQALGLAKSKASVQPLLDALNKEARPDVQKAIIRALGEIGEASAIEGLRPYAQAGSAVEEVARSVIRELDAN